MGFIRWTTVAVTRKENLDKLRFGLKGLGRRGGPCFRGFPLSAQSEENYRE